MRRIYGKCTAYAVITLAMAIMLSGCSIGAPTSSVSSQSSSKNGITVWVMQDDFTKETLNAINKQFEAQTGVRVHVQVQPWDGISTKLTTALSTSCLLYTSDAADDSLRVDLGGRRIIKKKKKK